MANGNDIGGKVGLDVTDFKAAVADLNRQIRVIESGFKSVAAGMDDWRTTSEGLQSRIDSLSKVTDLQRQKVANLKNEYDKIVASKGADSKAAQDLEVRINKETASLNKNELEMRKCGKSLEDLKNASDNAGKEVKQLGDEEEKAARKTSTLKDSFKGLGSHIGSAFATAVKITTAAIVSIGIATGAAAVGVFHLSQSASDLGEAQNVVESTFKSSGKAIEQWTDSVASSAGISKTMATQWVGSMGAMLKSSGLTEKSAADMSKALVQLAGDMSSFYNLDNETSWEKIRAGIAGETEPLKQLGINMSVANLEAYAMSQGIKKSYKEMSQAEQTTLRYNYLMKVTADAQGDFGKTLGTSFPNQLRVAQMNIQTLGMSIGSIFLPAILNMTKELNSSFSEINKLLADGFQSSDLSNISTIIIGILQKVVNGIVDFIPKAVGIIVPALQGLIGIIVQVLPGLLPPLLQGVIQLFNGLITLLQQNTQPLVTLAVSLVTQFATFILQALPQLLLVAIQIIIALVNGISAQLPTLIPIAVQAIFTIIQALIDNLPNLIQAAITLILALVQGIMLALPLIIEQSPKIVTSLIDGLVQAIPLLIDAAIKLILSLIDYLTNNLGLVITASMQIVYALSAGLIKAIPQLIAGVFKIRESIREKMLETDWIGVGKNIIMGIVNGIKSGIVSIANAAKEAAASALNSAKSFLGIHSPSRVMRDEVGQFIPSGIALGISDNAKQVDAAMAGLTNKLTNRVSADLSVNTSTNYSGNINNNNIVDVLKDLIDTLKNYPPTFNVDGKQLAIATAGPMSEVLAQRTNRRR